jgi:hypothetical protein
MTHRPTDDEPVAWDEVFWWRGHLKIPAAIVGIVLLVVAIGLAFYPLPPVSGWECGFLMAPEHPRVCGDKIGARAWQVVPALVVGLSLTSWGFYPTGDKGN